MAAPPPDPARAIAWLCRAAERVAMVLLGCMTVFLLVQVLARNVLALGLPWAEELARYAGLGVVYLVVPLLLLQDRHVKVDLLPARLAGGPARLLRILNDVVVLAFAGLFLWGGTLFLQRAARFSTAAMGIPNWIYYLPAVIGLLLLALVGALRLWRSVAGRDRP